MISTYWLFHKALPLSSYILNNVYQMDKSGDIIIINCLIFVSGFRNKLEYFIETKTNNIIAIQ